MCSRPRNRASLALGVAAAGNLLGSIGGGRVLSAGQGVTGLRLLGSGSLMALLFGTVVSIGLLRLAGRMPRAKGLAAVSGLGLVASAALLSLYSQSLGSAESHLPSGIIRLSGPLALAFFALLVLRCAAWLAARALRTGLISGEYRSWLGLTEAAYFGGLVVGLVVGLPAWIAGDLVLSALVLDIGLLAVTTAGDLFLGSIVARSTADARRAALTRSHGPRVPSVPQLTLAFASATIGCQIVVFHLADWLARPAGLGLRGWADSTLAAFYLGVAITAAASIQMKPLLMQGDRRQVTIRWGVAGAHRHAAVSTVAAISGTLIMAGVAGIATLATQLGASGRGAAWAGALAAIAAGALVFELLILAVINTLAEAGPGAVSLTIAIAGSLATLAMLAMLAVSAGLGGWLIVNALGLVGAVVLIRVALGACGRAEG